MFDRISQRYQTSGQWPFALLGSGVILFLGCVAFELVKHPDPSHAIGLAAIAYAIIKITLELTLDRAKVPVISTGLDGCRAISALMQEDAAAKAGHIYQVADLGSGRGFVTAYLARTLPQAHVTGIEGRRLPFWQAQVLQRLCGARNLEFHRADFMAYSCSEMDAVYVYLDGRMTQQAGEKLARELKPGAMVITQTFRLLGGWEPVKTMTSGAVFPVTFYVYRKV